MPSETIRLNDDGTLDSMIFEGADSIHIEQTDVGWWVGVYMPTGRVTAFLGDAGTVCDEREYSRISPEQLRHACALAFEQGVQARQETLSGQPVGNPYVEEA